MCARAWLANLWQKFELLQLPTGGRVRGRVTLEKSAHPHPVLHGSFFVCLLVWLSLVVCLLVRRPFVRSYAEAVYRNIIACSRYHIMAHTFVMASGLATAATAALLRSVARDTFDLQRSHPDAIMVARVYAACRGILNGRFVGGRAGARQVCAPCADFERGLSERIERRERKRAENERV